MLKSRNPLVPGLPPRAFPDTTCTAPDDEDAPAPLTIVTAPPGLPEAVVTPASATIAPPNPVDAAPTKIEIAPAEPPEASPVYRLKLPDAPNAVVPLLNNSDPLAAFAALAVRMTMAPDDEDAPNPLTTLITPPTSFADVVPPAMRTTDAPFAVFEEPARTLSEPPLRPVSAFPVVTTT